MASPRCAAPIGLPPKTKSKLAKVCPVIGAYGKDDETFAKEGERLEAILTRLGVFG